MNPDDRPIRRIPRAVPPPRPRPLIRARLVYAGFTLAMLALVIAIRWS